MPPAIREPNYQGPFGNTLLHGAVVNRDLKEVRRLLAAGADPDIANHDGRTPFHVAVIVGDSQLCGVLARETEDHLDRLLDHALTETFPASDPIAVTPG